jgi:hypothetical protein
MKYPLLILCALAVFLSCKKDPVAGPQGPQGPAGINGNPDKGTISGSVKQYNNLGKAYFTDLNTTTVSIAGTSISTVTDSLGNYKLTGVSAGIYDLLFNRKGSRPHKSTEVSFPGNGNITVHVQMSDTAQFKILTAEIKDSIYQGDPHVYVNLSTLADTYDRSVVFLFSDRSAINPEDPATFKMSLAATLLSGNAVVSFLFPYQNSYINNRFKSGQAIYAKVYPAVNPLSSGQYYDIKTEQNVFSMLGRAYPETFALTMP